MPNFLRDWLMCHGTNDPGRAEDSKSSIIRPVTYELRVLEILTQSLRKNQMRDLINGEKTVYEQELTTMGKSFADDAYRIMPDLVKWIVRLSYSYARLIGVMNFEVDLKTGRPRITRTTTIYAAVLNGIFFSLLPLQILSRTTVTAIWARSNLLHEYVVVIVVAIRLLGVILTILARWCQRRQLMHFINALRRLYWQKPQVKHLYRRGVISKCICGVLSEVLQMGVGLDALKNHLTLQVALSIVLLYMGTALLNLIIAQYYFAMLNVHGHYLLLNYELQGIISEAYTLSITKKPPRGMGVFVTKCCDLADRIDKIAQTQSKLQNIFTLMSRIFGIQGLCISSTYYLSSAASMYFTFSTYKYGTTDMGFSLWGLIMIFGSAIFYYADGTITTFILFYVLDAHEKMSKLLEERTTFGLELDERLETAFESIQLQMARNKLGIRILNLFEIKRSTMMSMSNSLIINTLLLIQYDIEHYPNRVN